MKVIGQSYQNDPEIEWRDPQDARAHHADIEAGGLPKGCSVVPLGKAPQWCFYRCVKGETWALSANAHTSKNILNLFGGDEDLLCRVWPLRSECGAITGWDYEHAAEALMSAAARSGIINPETLGFKAGYISLGSIGVSCEGGRP